MANEKESEMTTLIENIQRNVNDWRIQMALKEGTGLISVNKFGTNPAVSTTEETIWAVGGIRTRLSAAATMYVSCELASGATTQVIRVDGLGPNWELQTGFATLNNQTQVPIVAADGSAQTWFRIHRAYQVSAAPAPTDNVWIAIADTLTGGAPDTASAIHGFIDYTDGANQTQISAYTIPAGYRGFLLDVGSAMNASGGSSRTASVHILRSDLARGATVANPTRAPLRRQTETTLRSDGQISQELSFKLPIMFEQLTDLEQRATATANSSIRGKFTLLLVPWDYPSDWEAE